MHFKKNVLKKAVAAALSLATLCSLSTVAFAADKTLNQDTPTGTATVYYQAGKVTDPGTPDDPTDDTVNGTYIVTIPEYIKAAKVGETPVTEDVTAKEVLIPFGKTLNVKVAFADSLVLADNADTKITYDLQNQGAKIATGDTILSVAAGNPDAVTSTALGAVLTQAPSFSGTYNDTATFTVSVD